MSKVMILISGMPATGKTTFAGWLSKRLEMPLVCYDHIKEKTAEIMKKCGEENMGKTLLGVFPYEFFLFSCEEILKSSTGVIMEYFFSNRLNDILDQWTGKYGYRTFNIHMDAAPEAAYSRFMERNVQTAEDGSIRPPKISYEIFQEQTKQNRDFRYGERLITVDTTDFSQISYEEIYQRIICCI